MPYKCYLAGTIGGLTYSDAIGWREVAKKELNKLGISAASPLRWEERHWGKDEVIDPNTVQKNVMCCPRGIIVRDRWDTLTCDVLLVNLLNSPRISVGTVMELAWANISNKPTVVIMEDDNIHRHPMLDECIDYRVSSLEEGLDVVKRILVYE